MMIIGIVMVMELAMVGMQTQVIQQNDGIVMVMGLMMKQNGKWVLILAYLILMAMESMIKTINIQERGIINTTVMEMVYPML